MIVMLSSKALRSKPINMFMINQSAIDFTASLSIWLRHIYVTMDMTFDNYIWRSIYCKVWLSNLVQIFFFASSGYNLVALSMERYFAIMNPFAYDEEKASTYSYIIYIVKTLNVAWDILSRSLVSVIISSLMNNELTYN